MAWQTCCILLVCHQVTEGTDSGAEVESPDLPVEQDVQTEASESTEFTEALKLSAAPEPTITPEEELEQSTGPSLNYAFKLLMWRYYHVGNNSGYEKIV